MNVVVSEDNEDGDVEEIDANCSGLHRDDWLNILVLLVDENGDEVGGLFVNTPTHLIA